MTKTLQSKLTDIQKAAGAKVKVEIRLNVYAKGTACESYWVAPSAEVDLKWVNLTKKEFNEICQFYQIKTMRLNRMETEAKSLPHIQTAIRTTRITNFFNPVVKPLAVKKVKK